MSFAPTMVSSPFTPLQTLTENTHAEDLSSRRQTEPTPPDIKPFTLPSLASITANLTSSIHCIEPSQVGPHRNSYSLSMSGRRRFSPLGNNLDYVDPVSPLGSERSGSSFGERRPSLSGIGMSIASGNRPRSRSLLLGQAVSANCPDTDPPVDESASDSGGSDKKNEDNDSTALSKKRSRTLTTPSQQRRLMQILEQTRFPSTDVREQLARELGMTPRRVQIWFQNRRQGMKKALEQKTEQEVSVTPAHDFHRTRGYSFGAYPAQTDFYGQPGLHQITQAQFSASTMGAPSTNTSLTCNTVAEANEPQGHPHTSRSGARGIPRSLPHLQLSSNHYTASSNEQTGTVGEFLWSDPSTATSAYSMPTGTDRDSVLSPFNKVNQQSCVEVSSNLGANSSMVISRHRSHTNPDFFGIMNGFMGLSELGPIPNESINPMEHISFSNHKQVFDNGNEQPPRKHSWVGADSDPVPAWQEGLNSLKLEHNSYIPHGTNHHPGVNSGMLYTVPIEASESASGLYYSDRLAQSSMDASLEATAGVNREGVYAANNMNISGQSHLPEVDERAIQLANNHLRQRSESLHSQN